MARIKKGKLIPDQEIELTSMIDCVFLLLIFFMVTTVFKNPSQLVLTLPIAENPHKLDKRQLIAELDEEGNVALNSKLVPLESLDAYLIMEKQKSGINSMVIKADENAKHGEVIKIMMIARSVQIESIAMATDTKKE